jgi:uncharacterized protein (TIGR02145 family)
MKNITVYFFLICVLTKINAQNYQISFAGAGASLIVDSVMVENLSQCTNLNIAGSDILNLTATVGLNEISNYNNDGIIIYPNPATGSCSIEFKSTSGNNACISLFDMAGKVVIHQKEFLSTGYHKFLLNNIKSGAYSLKVVSDHYQYAAILISNYATQDKPVIENIGSVAVSDKQMAMSDKTKTGDIKGTKSKIDMQFNAGDTLKLTGRSGDYRSVIMLFPNQSQTVIFNFIKCTDADSNHYAVVQIGSQLWMQENLKTTKYRDGSVIPNVADSATWGNLSSGAYCDYHNLPAEGVYYGHLYNYYAVADSLNMCPIGWHVPSNREWNIMEKFLDNTVDTTALGGTGSIIGRILKEGCNTRWQYLDSTCGLNSAGFTALCTNYRVAGGAWSQAPNDNHDDCFWTSTSYNSSSAWFRSLRWCTRDIYVLFPMKKSGYSVRCIKDY